MDVNNELDDRRQRAREAYADEPEPRTFAAVDAAIEAATRVQITDEAIRDFAQAWHAAPQDGPPGARRRAGLAAALAALGLEVVE